MAQIDRMRSDARSIVRDLGFMQRGLAGTDLSPSAVHSLLELGYGSVTTAKDLGTLLHLEKSTVSRLVQKLESDGLIATQIDPNDKRARVLRLTDKGQQVMQGAEHFGRSRLQAAMDHLSPDQIGQVETGLSLFAKALAAETPTAPEPEIHIHQGYRPGLIGSVAHLHGTYYAEHYGFGAFFEAKVAAGLSEFMGRIDRPMNTSFSAYRGDRLLGSVSLDGEDLEEGVAHLRWFIVSPAAQGLGLGQKLLGQILDFADERGFATTRLWTFKGLNSARHLYEKHGFALIDEWPGHQWGKEVREQIFERPAARAK